MTPTRQGLYDPAFEHDSCGVAFVATLSGVPSHEIVEQGLSALRRLEHRGASGAEVNTGDGAGILVQVPDAFLRQAVDFELPEAGHYAMGMAFFPSESVACEAAVASIESIVESEGLSVLGWRDIPHDFSMIGSMALNVMPGFRQLFIAGPIDRDLQGLNLERRAYMVRNRVRNEADIYFASLSARTTVYKGMLDSLQVSEFFSDLNDPLFASALALVHSRFSTNTFPSWPLAHPFRYIAHNGEFNTIRGNRNWLRAREALFSSDVLPGDISRIFPINTPGAADSMSFDECLELLHLSGRSLPHSVLMMIPEAWENHETMDPARRSFYQYHASLIEPWDGPAFVAFTDGDVIGAVLDRNGLRPGRYWVTKDGLVVMASEVGVLDIDPRDVVRKGRLQPGRMFLVDTVQHRIIDDDEIKAKLATEQSYSEWVKKNQIQLSELPGRPHKIETHESVVHNQRTFGYTTEEMKIVLAPMARNGAEPIGSMGTDTPIAVLSDRSKPLFDYFKQQFAQVTNPPLDAIREELVTSLASVVGPEGNLLDPSLQGSRHLQLPLPVIDEDDLRRIIRVNEDGDFPEFETHVVHGLFEVAGGGDALEAALYEACLNVSKAIRRGAKLIVLSDRGSNDKLAPIPSLLLTSAVHHHLIREKTRTQVGLIVETGDARAVQHIAVMIAYGAAAVCPYVALESIEDLVGRKIIHELEAISARRNLIKALCKGVLKVMSKMGISTITSYTGSQVFECIGISNDVIERHFTGTSSRLGGIGMDGIAEEVAIRHRRAHLSNSSEKAHREIEFGGEYQWRRDGEFHVFSPQTVHKLQHSTRTQRYDIFKEYTSLVDEQSTQLATLRGLFKLDSAREPIDINKVEPASEIVKRFSTGAMSYGSISAEAHETLAIAMNRLDAKSNTGEGGEDSARFTPDKNGDLRRSSIKQVASGRFGVTSEYLTNADDIQIKMAQGAKPGEGGQLPGKKVWPWIAKTRNSTVGVGLISPPPHHDIYSIEDIAQLIHDLKNANPSARVHVKLVAESGVGTVAAGVAKAHADVVLISGHDGGTGASPLNSLKHAGAPWELGLAETQQTLLLNKLRDRIVVQTDGGLKTGRDVVIATLLGAEEFGFASAPLVVSGCIMMRVCHLDTCPVGVATQNPELRKRFSGKPEFVVTYFEYIAEEVRELLAQLGFATIEEAVGQVEVLDTRDAVDHWKASGLDLSPILYLPELADDADRYNSKSQDHGLDAALDNKLISEAQSALDGGDAVKILSEIRNGNRTVGTMLGHELTKRYGATGLPDDTIDISLIGSAGQSLGAFLPRGITLRLTGDANDYVGKGLCGGRVSVTPHKGGTLIPEQNIIAGNVLLYGATSGEAYFRGIVGERFCVRNSGATAVVEGVGDHACEYMTGGTVVILGETGRNFGAGMSGGVAYVLDRSGMFPSLVNPEMVDLDPLDERDAILLSDIITMHMNETGSTVAADLLESWSTSLAYFVKVMPRDLKRVTRVAEAAKARGESPDEAVMEAVNG